MFVRGRWEGDEAVMGDTMMDSGSLWTVAISKEKVSGKRMTVMGHMSAEMGGRETSGDALVEGGVMTDTM